MNLSYFIAKRISFKRTGGFTGAIHRIAVASTLHYLMEACAENNTPLLILDRPNPNGDYIDGPILEKEFGKKLETTMVGFPVIRGKLPTPFDMYEQAKLMGKGNEMKKVLFRTIHKDKVTGVLDRSIREVLIKEVGLDPKVFEEGLASGKPAQLFEEGKKWGERIKLQQTPTILLDGNIKVEKIDPENLKVLIHSILDADSKK